MRKLIASAWITLDGIFDADTMGQWFMPYDSTERQDHIREELLASDAVLLGRTTYEMLAPYWSQMKNNEMGIAGKLNSVPKFVVSTSLKKAGWNNTTIVGGDVMAEIKRLKQQPGQQILVEGSATLVQSLSEAGLVDEYRFLVQPFIMGEGKRFFKDGMHQGLKLVSSQALASGVLALCYEAAKK